VVFKLKYSVQQKFQKLKTRSLNLFLSISSLSLLQQARKIFSRELMRFELFAATLGIRSRLCVSFVSLFLLIDVIDVKRKNSVKEIPQR
jgi:hypothetical protein